MSRTLIFRVPSMRRTRAFAPVLASLAGAARGRRRRWRSHRPDRAHGDAAPRLAFEPCRRSPSWPRPPGGSGAVGRVNAARRTGSPANGPGRLTAMGALPWPSCHRPLRHDPALVPALVILVSASDHAAAGDRRTPVHRWILPHSRVRALPGPSDRAPGLAMVLWVSHFSPLFDAALEDPIVIDVDRPICGSPPCRGGRVSGGDPIGPSPLGLRLPPQIDRRRVGMLYPRTTPRSLPWPSDPMALRRWPPGSCGSPATRRS